LENGYKVYLTADHGSVCCRGNGIRPEKHLVEDRARRALLYPGRALAEDFAGKKNLWIYGNTNSLGKRLLSSPLTGKCFLITDNGR